MKEIATVPLSVCSFVKQHKSLRLSSEFVGMPSQLMIKSHHTGMSVRFVPVGPEDKLFDQDQWDGEMMVYRPVGNVPNVDHLVIFNEY
jgi:hypothetical protein